MIQSIIKSSPNDKIGLQLAKIEVDPAYLSKWNESSKDFVCLVKNGELLRPTLYRIGGMGNPNVGKDKYFLLLKYVEAVYDLEFLKGCYPDRSNKQLESQRNHLEGCWCILDSEGNERIVFKQFQSPWLIKDSCLYSLDSDCYNIETGEKYGRSSNCLESNDYVFIANLFDKDHSKRGILKIKKSDGTSELFP